MGNTVNTGTNLQVQCLSVRCLPLGSTGWGRWREARRDPRLWGRPQAMKGSQVYLLCPVLATISPSLGCRAVSEGPTVGFQLPLPQVAFGILEKMFLLWVCYGLKALWWGDLEDQPCWRWGELWCIHSFGPWAVMPVGHTHQRFGLSGRIGRQRYLNTRINPSFPLLSRLLAAAGTWQKRRTKRGGKKGIWKNLKSWSWSADLLNCSIADPSLSYTQFQICAET